MNAPQPVVAGRQVGTSVLCWLADFLPCFVQHRGRGGRKALRMEELFQLPDALSMNPAQPFLASGPVGTAVLGQLAAHPLLKDPLLQPFAEEDIRVAGSMKRCVQGTIEFCDGQARPAMAVGGVSAAGRGYLALFSLFACVSC
jgi:hypothetical protein